MSHGENKHGYDNTLPLHLYMLPTNSGNNPSVLFCRPDIITAFFFTYEHNSFRFTHTCMCTLQKPTNPRVGIYGSAIVNQYQNVLKFPVDILVKTTLDDLKSLFKKIVTNPCKHFVYKFYNQKSVEFGFYRKAK